MLVKCLSKPHEVSLRVSPVTPLGPAFLCLLSVSRCDLSSDTVLSLRLALRGLGGQVAALEAENGWLRECALAPPSEAAPPPAEEAAEAEGSDHVYDIFLSSFPANIGEAEVDGADVSHLTSSDSDDESYQLPSARSPSA